ncbi:MAG: hypothetical protein ICV60_05230 [Pyrinomonadaceae bacterium]|nr:hypothetical protein [Pyrinomonadaceae bacterium]
MKERKANRELLIVTLLIAVSVAALLSLPALKRRGVRGSLAAYVPGASSVEAAGVGSWAQALKKIKEDRGEPVGKQAKVDVPQQLKHYSDTRRFLAVQVAECVEHGVESPQDFVDLAGMIKKGELVELKPVTENYVLVGVGGLADKEPFTRYENGKRIALYNEAELGAEYARIEEARANIENEIAGAKQEIASLSRRERSKRASLQSELNEKEKTLRALVERKELLDDAYGTPKRRQQFLGYDETVESLAHDFGGRSYTTADPRSRREMKVRMLSHLRPEALKVLDEIAEAYRQRYERPLPVTSLVRPDEYQQQLGKVNPNATRIETPPHSTGLAFDIFYGYMTADEQDFVMNYLARLKDEGRIEVLRENRNHFHVFAFVDGKRPDESFVRDSLGGVRPSKAKPVAETERKASKKADSKKVEKRGRRRR